MVPVCGHWHVAEILANVAGEVEKLDIHQRTLFDLDLRRSTVGPDLDFAFNGQALATTQLDGCVVDQKLSGLEAVRQLPLLPDIVVEFDHPLVGVGQHTAALGLLGERDVEHPLHGSVIEIIDEAGDFPDRLEDAGLDGIAKLLVEGLKLGACRPHLLGEFEHLVALLVDWAELFRDRGKLVMVAHVDDLAVVGAFPDYLE